MLNKLKASQLKSNEPKKHSDGGGLFFRVRPGGKGGAKKDWVFRFTLAGKRSEMGLGSFPGTSMQKARELRDRHAAAVKEGLDPRLVRDEAREAALTPVANETPTLKDMIEAAFEAKKADLKDDGKAGNWMDPLRLYVLPVIGDRLVTDITQHVIKDCLSPVWKDKHPSAKKALMRINIALEYAAALDLDVDLQAVKKARLLMGTVDHKVTNHKAINYEIAPAYFQQLDLLGSAGALKLLMLTGVRSAEIRFAKAENIDWNRAVLTTEPERVKGLKRKVQANRIALSSEAMRLLESLTVKGATGIIFPNRLGRPHSDNAMSKLMRESKFLKEHGESGTPHGMRSTLKAFILDKHPELPSSIVELVLSHKTEGDVAAAYTRTDQIEHQRAVLERWGRYLVGDRTPIVDQFSPDGVVAGGVPASE